MNKKAQGYFFLVLTFIVWGSNYVVTRFATGLSIPSQVLTGLRTIASLIPIALIARRSMPFPKVAKEDRKYFVLIGILGYFLMHNLNILGISMTSASTSGTINGLTPVAITLIASVVLKEKLDWVKLLCLALAIAGTLVISSGGLSGSALGLAFLVLALIVWGITSVLMRKLAVKYPSIMITYYALIAASCCHLPVIGVTAVVNGGLDIFNWPTVLSVLYLGFIVTGIGHMLWVKSLGTFEASFCSCFYPLQSISATVLGVIFLGEKVGLMFYLGLALVTADVVIMCLHNRKLEKAAQQQ